MGDPRLMLSNLCIGEILVEQLEEPEEETRIPEN